MENNIEFNYKVVENAYTGSINYVPLSTGKDKNIIIKSIYDWMDSILVAFIAVILIFTFFLGKVQVDGPSMENTLHSNDQLIITNFNYSPKQGDVVIVSRNSDNSIKNIYDENKQPIVKRIIAVSGDTIEIKDKQVFVNDKKLDEPYIKSYNNGPGTDNKQFQGKHTVPKGKIFIMGDNRYDSHDSRSLDIWYVDERYVIGEVLLRVYPFNSIGTF